MNTNEKTKELARHFFPEVLEFRRHFHRYPELSGKEKETAIYIAQVLDKIGIPYKKDIAGHGIVALLKGELPGNRTIALRADMDALPIEEVSDKDYRSQHSGVMHACGHDAHIASVLGALLILNSFKASFGGTVKAIFQPSEEDYDGGAPFMIQEGVLHDPEVDLIIAQHVTPGIESGMIGIKEGPFMASTDEIFINIKGKGGHAALVDEFINPVIIGMEILKNLNTFISKNQPEKIPTVLTFGRFIADGLTNRVPEEAQMAGTLRTFNEEWRNQALQNIEAIASETAQKHGGICEINIRHGYPVLVNDPATTQRIKQYAATFLGEKNVVDIPYRMTAEDFAYFLQEKPGVLYRLGSSNKEKGIIQSLHSNNFDIDESSLITGMGLLSWIAINELSKK